MLETTRADEGGFGVPRAFVLGKGRRVPRGWELALLGDPPSPSDVLRPAPPSDTSCLCCNFRPKPARPAPVSELGVPLTNVLGRRCRWRGLSRCSMILLRLPRAFRPTHQVVYACRVAAGLANLPVTLPVVAGRACRPGGSSRCSVILHRHLCRSAQSRCAHHPAIHSGGSRYLRRDDAGRARDRARAAGIRLRAPRLRPGRTAQRRG